MTHPTIPQMLDRRDRAARQRRILARLHAGLSAIAVILSGGFALLMLVKVATAGGA